MIKFEPKKASDLLKTEISEFCDASEETYILWRPWVLLICTSTLFFHGVFFVLNQAQGHSEPVIARAIAVVVLLPLLFERQITNDHFHKWLRRLFIPAFAITGPGLLLSGMLIEMLQNPPSLSLVTQRQYEFASVVGIMLISSTSIRAVVLSSFVVCTFVLLTFVAFTPLKLFASTSDAFGAIVSTYIFFFVAFALVIRFRNDQTSNRMDAAFRIGAAIAHQLRTPLATIRNISSGTQKRLPELVEGYEYAVEHGHVEQPISPEKLEQLRESLQSISGEVEHSHALIDILIANSKPIEMLDKPTNPVSVRAVAERAIRGYPYNSPYERSLVTLKEGADFEVYAQENMLLHVLYNLIGNAVEFSQKGEKPAVELSVSSSTEWNIMSVRDTGIGVSRENQYRIFDPFFSLNSQNGTGIGLSFCKSVMEGVGGKIECQSQEGEYCDIRLYFPKSSD